VTQSAQLFFESLSSAAAITGLVGQAEDLYFDAKVCSVPLSEQDQKHLAEALSGFANADGGVLIYGLVAKGGDRSTPDVVTSVDPVKKLPALHAGLLSLVGQIVEPPVPGCRVDLRPLERLDESGFVLVFVPSSEMVHRSRKDREFYRRHGNGFHRMEYFEIAEMFGRRRRPTLRVSAAFREFAPSPHGPAGARYVISIENVGRGIAKFPGLLLKDSRACIYGLDGNLGFGLPPKATSRNNDLFYGGGADHVIYPQANLDVTMIEVGLYRKGDRLVTLHTAVEYELYAEDMETKTGILDLTKQELPAQ
jgi:hypothetical protein